MRAIRDVRGDPTYARTPCTGGSLRALAIAARPRQHPDALATQCPAPCPLPAAHLLQRGPRPTAPIPCVQATHRCAACMCADGMLSIGHLLRPGAQQVACGGPRAQFFTGHTDASVSATARARDPMAQHRHCSACAAPSHRASPSPAHQSSRKNLPDPHPIPKFPGTQQPVRDAMFSENGPCACCNVLQHARGGPTALASSRRRPQPCAARADTLMRRWRRDARRCAMAARPAGARPSPTVRFVILTAILAGADVVE